LEVHGVSVLDQTTSRNQEVLLNEILHKKRNLFADETQIHIIHVGRGILEGNNSISAPGPFLPFFVINHQSNQWSRKKMEAGTSIYILRAVVP
jgi:hypothetical protein